MKYLDAGVLQNVNVDGAEECMVIKLLSDNKLYIIIVQYQQDFCFQGRHCQGADFNDDG